MTTYSSVIGVNYGDEGKGLIVDWLSGQNTLVVRANGGAQAGHTVVLPDGARHVFSHFGAGYFRGASTYLGPEFFVNPLLYRKEDDVLRHSIKKRHRLYLNGRSPVVTLYDILINQKLERSRGNAKHGSCGVGTFETWHRHNHPDGISLTVADLFGHRELLKDKLHEIKMYWTPLRLKTLGLRNDADLDVRPFLQDVDHLMRSAEIACWGDSLPALNFDHVVFEGAQGLLLDMDNMDMFPHLTPSKTGLKNVLNLLPKGHEKGPQPLHVYYVSRSYATRHGNGPLPHEEMPFEPRINDLTNFTNEFQGSIRTAPLDLDIMSGAIGRDTAEANSRLAYCAYNMVFTHLDAFSPQKDGLSLEVVHGGYLEKMSISKIVGNLEQNSNCLIRNIYGSNGPTRDHVLKLGTDLSSWH